ncbi:MAG: type II toxin-antitoxin system RelB/DinJ family antitoxin [Oscillospiraceae bacterium]|nr:type II toxin-antitoxin system RelB/DinJ family antitoxin [Oscillospiraceae bacterium]
MAETTNLNIRIDRELKSEADFILGRMGMNLSTAVNVFVRQVVQERAIPFRIQLSDDNKTDALLRDAAEIDAAIADGATNIYSSPRELFAEWEREQ